jgi:hypothetical protein
LQPQPDFGPNMNQPSPPVQRSWWGRNWIWVVPLGCLTPIVLCGGFIGVVGVTVFGVLKSSDPYKHAVAAAQANGEVKTLLGEPISEGMLPSGNINLDGSGGRADLSIPISGPKGSATIHVAGTKESGRWNYSRLEVVPSGNGKPIDLRPQAEAAK